MSRLGAVRELFCGGQADVRRDRCSESDGDPRGGPGRGSVGRRRPPGARARAPTRGSAGARLGRRGRCRACKADADLRSRRDPLRSAKVVSRRAGSRAPGLREEGTPAPPRCPSHEVTRDRTAPGARRRQRDRGTLAPGIVLDRLAQVRGHARVRRDHFPRATAWSGDAPARWWRVGRGGNQADGPRRHEDPPTVCTRVHRNPCSEATWASVRIGPCCFSCGTSAARLRHACGTSAREPSRGTRRFGRATAGRPSCLPRNRSRPGRGRPCRRAARAGGRPRAALRRSTARPDAAAVLVSASKCRLARAEEERDWR